jgi:hypothetical protein
MRVWSSTLPLALLVAYVLVSSFYCFSAIQAVVFLIALFMLRTQVGWACLGWAGLGWAGLSWAGLAVGLVWSGLG